MDFLNAVAWAGGMMFSIFLIAVIIGAIFLVPQIRRETKRAEEQRRR